MNITLKNDTVLSMSLITYCDSGLCTIWTDLSFIMFRLYFTITIKKCPAILAQLGVITHWNFTPHFFFFFLHRQIFVQKCLLSQNLAVNEHVVILSVTAKWSQKPILRSDVIFKLYISPHLSTDKGHICITIKKMKDSARQFLILELCVWPCNW